MSALRDDRGSVTAEFAVVLPAVLMVLVLAVGAIMLATQRITLTSAAAEVARLEARGDHAAAQARLAGVPSHVSVSRATRGPLHCVTLRAAPGAGALSIIQLSSTGCAARSEAGS